MLRSIFLISVTGFWISMMSLLIKREFFEFTPIQSPHEVLALENLALRQEYRAIYLGQERVGFTFSVLEPLEETEEDAYELRDNSYLSFLFLGNEREIMIQSKSRLDRQLAVKSLEAKITSSGTWTKITGKRAGNNLEVVFESPNSQPSGRTIPISQPIFLTEALHYIWTPENLKIGKKGNLQTWNPLLGAFQTVEFSINRKETIPFGGKEQEAFVVFFKINDIETRSWISPEGIVLKEESPTGLMLQKEDAYKIFDEMRESRKSPPDLPNLFSIPSNLNLEKPELLQFLKVRVDEPSGEKILEIKKDNFKELPELHLPLQNVPQDVKPYLESNTWVAAEDPVIQKTAKEIVGTETSALIAALKINRWVHQHVKPFPSVMVPKAREVLENQKGDCNEYTVLFTALARAAGIPTKTIAGLVYQKGRFFYHAWAQVYLGKWVTLDPTFDQSPADVTHIPIVEGELESQIRLVEKLGRIKVHLLEVK